MRDIKKWFLKFISFDVALYKDQLSNLFVLKQYPLFYNTVIGNKISMENETKIPNM